jgi:serine/threonine-protein kinase
MRVMFIWEGEPLHDASVRLTHEQDTFEYITDQDGQISTDLLATDVFARVRVDAEKDTWLEQTINLAGKKSLVVVDLGASMTDTIAAPPTPIQKPSGLTLDNVLAGTNQTLGERYVFEEVLGRGGMGVVVRARDELLNREVAIKMLNEEFSDNEDAQAIFLTEARAIATLSHPNLVGIYDVTMIEGRAMIVFEYVEGKNLERVLGDSGRLTEAALLRVGIQMARALRYLHEQGFIHRDIKPANVLLQSDGLLRIIDFGLARSLEQIQMRGTQVRGTPAYMAPEQIEGAELLEATDVYQLGVTLYELACGRLPFETGNIGYSHLFKEPPPLLEVVPDFNEHLAKLIHSCLVKEPAGRPTTNELFFLLQEAYLAGSYEYDRDQSVLKPSDQLLFASTSEIDVEQIRRNRALQQDRDPALASLGTGNYESPPAVTAPSSEVYEEEQSGTDAKMVTLLTAFGLIGAVVALIGIVAVMNMPEKKPVESPPEATAVVADQKNPSEKDAAKEEDPVATSTPPAEQEPRKDETDNAIGAFGNATTPGNTAPPEVDDPLAEEKPEVAAKDDAPVRDKVAVSKPANEKPESEKQASEAKTNAPSKEDPSSGEETVANNPAKNTETETSSETAPVETSPEATVASSAPAEKEEGAEDEKDSEGEETKTTRKVIRKKIIRKKVIRKKPEDSKPESAPTSF